LIPPFTSMAESVEYALVVMVSTLFVAGSVVTYTSFSTFEAGAQFSAEFHAVYALASAAVVNGSSRESLSLPASTIRCDSESLAIKAGSFNQSAQVEVPCSFAVTVPQGLHTLSFSLGSSGLDLVVS